MGNAEISKKTRSAISTVEKHIEHIYRKIQVKSRSSAAIWLLRRQLEARDKETALLKQIMAEQGGSSAASSR